MLRRGTINRLIIVIGAVLFFLSVLTLQGNCVNLAHEDPGYVEPIPKEQDEIVLQGQIQDMIYRAFLVTYYINTSYYGESRTFLDAFDDFYFNYNAQLKYSGITDSVYNNIDQRMAVTKKDLRTLLDGFEGFNGEYDNFTMYKSAGDMVNATRCAVIARNYYRNMCSANTSLSSNAHVVVRLLNDTIVYTEPLNYSDKLMNWTMARVSKNESIIDEQLSHTVLKLTADRNEINIGDRIYFNVKLKTDSPVSVDGQQVILYVNDRKSGEGHLNIDGSCTIAYTPDDRNISLIAYADLVPDDPRLVPVQSDPVEIRIMKKDTVLSLSFTPSTVTYGDTIHISGTLTTADGSRVSDRSIGLYINNRRIGDTTTASDGTYAFTYPVTHETPGGMCTLGARYTSQTSDVYLSSASLPGTMNVTVQGTQLTLESRHETLIGGDIGEFYGMLVVANGAPVGNAVVSIYDGDRLLGRNVTDGNGAYLVRSTIPYDIGTGDHSLYAMFRSAGALEGALSNNWSITFGEVMPYITGNTAPRVLFDGDVLYLQGYLLTQNNMPMAGQQLTINISNINITTVETNSKGRYEYLYRISYKDRVGLCEVYITSPEYTYSAGSTVILPYNKLAMVMAALIIPPIIFYILVKITRFDRFVMRRMRRGASRIRRNRPARMSIDKEAISEPPMPAPPLDLEQEIALLKAMISEGRLKDSLIRVYAVARRIAAHYGNEVKDSSTHREFYWQVAGKYASASQPLSTIINKYESVNYGRGTLNGNDVDIAMDCLNNVYHAMESQGTEEHRP